MFDSCPGIWVFVYKSSSLFTRTRLPDQSPEEANHLTAFQAAAASQTWNRFESSHVCFNWEESEPKFRARARVSSMSAVASALVLAAAAAAAAAASAASRGKTSKSFFRKRRRSRRWEREREREWERQSPSNFSWAPSGEKQKTKTFERLLGLKNREEFRRFRSQRVSTVLAKNLFLLLKCRLRVLGNYYSGWFVSTLRNRIVSGSEAIEVSPTQVFAVGEFSFPIPDQRLLLTPGNVKRDCDD